jgi:hypothetical protein
MSWYWRCEEGVATVNMLLLDNVLLSILLLDLRLLKIAQLGKVAEEAGQRADGAISMSSSTGLEGGSVLLSASISQRKLTMVISFDCFCILKM